MPRLPPVRGSALGFDPRVQQRHTLEQAPSNSRGGDKGLATALSRRLRRSFPLPAEEDEEVSQLLLQLAAKLQEPPPT